MTYKDIGGMNVELQQVREVVELPLKYPQLFDRLGIDAPKGCCSSALAVGNHDRARCGQ